MSYYKLTDNYFYAARIDSGSYIHVASALTTSSIYVRFKPTGSLPTRIFEIDGNNYIAVSATGSLYFQSGSTGLPIIPDANIKSTTTGSFYSLLIKTNTSSLNTFDVTLGYQTIQDTNLRSVKVKSGSFSTTNLINELNLGKGFSGYIQDYRIYNELINNTIFTTYCENPFAYYGNTLYSYWTSLIYRLPLGIDKKKYNHSTNTIVSSSHPNVNYLYSNAYASGVAVDFPDNTSYVGFYEAQYKKQPYLSTFVETTDKVLITNNYSTGSLNKDTDNRTIISVPGDSHIGLYFNLNKAVNDDILNSLGAINIGDYIGGWDSNDTEEFQQLEYVRENYFKNYTHNNNIKAQLRQVKYFNNSIFTHAEQFIPARSNFMKGVLVDNHYLKRNSVRFAGQTLNSIRQDYSGSLSQSLFDNQKIAGYNNSHYINSSSILDQYTALITNIVQDLGPSSGSVMPSATQSRTSEIYHTNTQDINGNWPYAQINDYQDLGKINREYGGCYVRASDINQPSPDIPQNEPAVEIWINTGTSLFSNGSGILVE